MKQISNISLAELKQLAQMMYGNIVKANVDVDKRIIVVDMKLHADGEAYMLENGSEQAALWGINLHPSKFGTEDFIEFDSMINLKPGQGNFSRGIECDQLRAKIRDIIHGAVHEA
jgi:hypothetical protein